MEKNVSYKELRVVQHFDFAQCTKGELRLRSVTKGRKRCSRFATHVSLFIVLLCCTGIFANAQNSVSYGYDDSGNRISRTINMPMLPTPPQDSTKTGDEKSQEIYTDALAETAITIYPNPTKGQLTVKISNMPQDSASSLTLFDMHGRVITQKQHLSEENRLDISTQPAGTYIMQIAVGSETTSWKIVKQ